MWNVYSRFYKEVLQKDIATCVLVKNLNKVPSLNIVSLFCLSSLTLKKIVASLACLSLLSNNRSYKSSVIFANKSFVPTKTRRKQPLGATLFFVRGNLIQILHYMVHFTFPQLDATFLFFLKRAPLNFTCSFDLTSIISTLLPFFNSFQGISRVRFVFSAKSKKLLLGKKGCFFLQFLKLPLNIVNFFAY